MFGFWAAKDLSTLEGDLSFLFKDSEFQRELTLILLAGLQRLGYDKSRESLEQESGLKLPGSFGKDFREFVLQGRFDQALGKTFIWL